MYKMSTVPHSYATKLTLLGIKYKVLINIIHDGQKLLILKPVWGHIEPRSIQTVEIENQDK